MPEDKREILKNRLMREFAMQYFEATGDAIKLLEMVDKKEILDGILNTGYYKELEDKTVERLLASENSLNELYQAFINYEIDCMRDVK